jgi:hypothetical protein
MASSWEKAVRLDVITTGRLKNARGEPLRYATRREFRISQRSDASASFCYAAIASSHGATRSRSFSVNLVHMSSRSTAL